MVVGVMELHLALFERASLKDKRSIVRRIVHRCRKTFNVSASEVDLQDRNDRAVIGFAAVGTERRHVEGLLQKLEHFVERMALAELLDAPKSIENY